MAENDMRDGQLRQRHSTRHLSWTAEAQKNAIDMTELYPGMAKLVVDLCPTGYGGGDGGVHEVFSCMNG
jgi:hypothetical protein